MNFRLLTLMCLLAPISLFSQENTSVIGSIFSNNTNTPIHDAEIILVESNTKTKTNKDGSFNLSTILEGEQLLQIEALGYIRITIPITIEKGKVLDIGSIYLNSDLKKQEQYFTAIDLATLNFENANNNEQQLLQATKDPVLKSAAYHWSATFFRLRGLNSEHQKILFNGIEMNKLLNDRPNWNNWTGLNDIIRNQETTNYYQQNPFTFGSLNGVTNFNTNALSFKKGTKISMASTSRTFRKRLMLTHHTGLQPNNWSYSFSTSASYANEGYIEGTNLKTLSFFSSISRKINNKHNLNLSLIYTPVERGRASPNTKEVTEIKGTRYNAYWGFQEGKIRNSRIRKVQEPFAILSHSWKFSEKLNITNNALIQYGHIKNSRLDHTGSNAIITNGNVFFEGIGTNTDPTYYQKLPSYFLRTTGEEDYESAFLADRYFRENGQIEWANLYETNNTNNQNATYIVLNDVTNDFLIAANSIWNYQFSEKTSFQGAINFKNLVSKNYAEVEDLLNGNGYLDIDAFSEDPAAQSNLQTPNRIVTEGEDFRYNYHINAKEVSGFLQVNSTIEKFNFNVALSAIAKSYQRNGKYENGYNPGSLSFGKSNYVNQLGFGVKVNLDYPINPKLYLKSNIFYNENPLNINQAFINIRQSNTTAPNKNSEKQLATDFTLNYRFNKISARFSTFYNQFKDGTSNSFFFSEDISNLGRIQNFGFFQEHINTINTQHIGLEFGIEAELTNSISALFATSIGHYKYTNNPNLSLYANNSSAPIYNGATQLNNYYLANGPQQVVGFGFSYRDPKYWWFSTQLNYYQKSFINISPFLRTSNFATDIDGLPIVDYDPIRARELLAQEEFDPYFLWNAIGGKSWKVKKKYIGFTLGVQNILNQIYKTGGFEQSRNSNYTALNEDQSRTYPLFGPRYWYGSGTTYYLNTYLRF